MASSAGAGSEAPDLLNDLGARGAARSVFLVLLAVFTATMTGLPDNTDSECEFQTTSALARTGWLAAGGTPEGELMASRPEHAPVRIGTDGGAYAWFGVGQAALAMPFYIAGRAVALAFPEIEERHAATFYYGVPRSEYFAHLFVGWRNPLLTALSAWCLVRVLVELGGSRRAAWLGGLSYGLASFAWPQARSTLSDVQATFLVLAAFALLLAVRRRLRNGVRVPWWQPAFLGLFLGAAFLTRSATAPALAVLGLAALPSMVVLKRRHGAGAALGAAASFAVPALACFGLYLWTNVARFGDPLDSGYGEALATGQVFGYPVLLGLAGLAVAPGKGLAWLAPLVLLAPVGLWRSWHPARPTRERELWLPLVVLGVSAAVSAPVATMSGWYGGWTYGPRYVLPALPFLWAAAWLAFDRAGSALRFAFGALLLLGLATNLPGVLVDHETHLELAVQAARIEWGPELEDSPSPEDLDGQLFQHIQWDWRFAAPWAHWRILRHLVSGGGDVYSAREIFFLEADAALTVSHDRQRGFRHFAWVDLVQRLDGAAWPALLASLALFLAGVRAASLRLP